ncbi:helix-turn-helix transcriptional regulator [Pseudomonas aeruginosa]|nr:helix-turn-helix transcriptional regulator [Pseudomonas aeruginosa]MBG4718207.1 helix-turn-helix transcriptional regulator [Pseudomonas aeruginosa]HEJ3062527.1 helix-turn-helix transcriptional regulator [Pseudomonas aeruginosa]
MTPLKKARTKKGWRLADVIDRLRAIDCVIDTGNLSRVENGKQQASTALAEKLCQVFEGELTELHILYPERFTEKPPGQAA